MQPQAMQPKATEPQAADHYLLGWDQTEHLIPPAKQFLKLNLHHALPGRESLALLLIAQSNGLKAPRK